MRIFKQIAREIADYTYRNIKERYWNVVGGGSAPILADKEKFYSWFSELNSFKQFYRQFERVHDEGASFFLFLCGSATFRKLMNVPESALKFDWDDYEMDMEESSYWDIQLARITDRLDGDDDIDIVSI